MITLSTSYGASWTQELSSGACKTLGFAAALLKSVASNVRLAVTGMSTAHLALNYRPQGVTGDLASSTTSVGVHGMGCEIRPRSSRTTTFRDRPPEYNPLVLTQTFFFEETQITPGGGVFVWKRDTSIRTAPYTISQSIPFVYHTTCSTHHEFHYWQYWFGGVGLAFSISTR